MAKAEKKTRGRPAKAKPPAARESAPPSAKANAAEQSSAMLAHLRDKLLPRLLSGEVSVGHAECEAEAVA